LSGRMTPPFMSNIFQCPRYTGPLGWPEKRMVEDGNHPTKPKGTAYHCLWCQSRTEAYMW
jgi:hypothetical protein